MKKRFWTKRVRALVIIATVLAVLVTLGTALTKSSGSGWGTNLVSSVMTPLRSGLRAIDRTALQLYDYVYRYEKLEAENENLRQEVARQEAAIDTAERYRRENQRLRELLELEQENEAFSYVSAYVISWDTSVWESRITVNKGSRDGLDVGMCAITSTGQVVGLVTECGSNWAIVSTIYDVSVQISAQVASSGCSGVVQAVRTEDMGSSLQMRYLPASAALINGERVITAGSEKFPKGLLLGTVESSGMDETGISKFATLSTQLQPAQLEQVFIITNYEK